MKRIHIIEASVAIGLVVSIITSFVGFGMGCKEIRENVVRLHIFANSDSEKDQQVKLIVRDALLSCGSELFSGNADVNNAKEILAKQNTELTEIANQTLADNGFDYTAKICLTEEYFTTRFYNDFTLPAGDYLALKVILGEGKGHNWWCVMFPPLCLPAASENKGVDIVLGENGSEIVQNYTKYEVKFKFIEIYESIKNRIRVINNHKYS